MSYNHYTCLVYREQEDGSKKLVNVPVQAWYEQTQEDKGLSGDKRRYYTVDYCERDDNSLDYLIVEVDRNAHRAWNAANMRHIRNHVIPAKSYQMVSLDAPVPGNVDNLAFADIIPDVRENTQSDCEISVFLTDLRQDLQTWKPWAMKMLDLCQCGGFDTPSRLLVEQFGISARQVRTYKAQFLTHVKEFVCRWLEENEKDNFTS